MSKPFLGCIVSKRIRKCTFVLNEISFQLKEEPVAEAAPNPVSLPQGQRKMPSHDHIADPGGMQVATSLPTALMQPNLIAVSNKREPHTLWALRERYVLQILSPE